VVITGSGSCGIPVWAGVLMPENFASVPTEIIYCQRSYNSFGGINSPFLISETSISSPKNIFWGEKTVMGGHLLLHIKELFSKYESL
jgi:hypothetical protein